MNQDNERARYEMMAHVPLMAHGKAEDVLIVGNDSGIAVECLKHRTIRHLLQVHEDPPITEASTTLVPQHVGQVFADKRFSRVTYKPGEFIAGFAGSFDVVIIDTTYPQGADTGQFWQKFYEHCRVSLKQDGVLVARGVPSLHQDELESLLGRLSKVFVHWGCYMVSSGSSSDDTTLVWASDHGIPAIGGGYLASRHKLAGSFPTQYWTPWKQQQAFNLPPHIQEIVQKAQR